MASSMDEVVEDIMRIHRSLPSRPAIDEVDAAKALIRNVDKEEQVRLDAIARKIKSPDVPEELFVVLLEMHKSLAFFHGKDQKRDALRLLDLENLHSLFDEFIHRASKYVPSTMTGGGGSFSYKPHSSASTSTSSSSLYYSGKEPVRTSELFTKDDSFVNKAKSALYVDSIEIRPSVSSNAQILDSSLKPPITSSSESFPHFGSVPLRFPY